MSSEETVKSKKERPTFAEKLEFNRTSEEIEQSFRRMAEEAIAIQ